MDHAKKMVLIDEKMLDWRKHDMMFKRPLEEHAKYGLSKQMRLELDNDGIPPDVKAKQYQQMLSRFLNTKRQPSDDLIPKVETTIKTAAHRPKQTVRPVAVRKSSRAVKPPKKFAWEQW